MFVLPRPPQYREGRRVTQFSSRPVSATDAAHALHPDRPNVHLTRVVDDDGSSWFPASASNRTTQDEFSCRAFIIQAQLQEFSAMRDAFLRTRSVIIERHFHSLQFDEQWERECLEKDSRTELWFQITEEAQHCLLSDVVREERVGRASVEQLAMASFFSVVSTAEFISRRHLTASMFATMWDIQHQEHHARQYAAIASAAAKDLSLLKAFETSCREYFSNFHTVAKVHIAFLTDESTRRRQLLGAFWESRRIVVEYFAESTFSILWETEGSLQFTGNAKDLLDIHATIIQAIVRGWLLRRKLTSRR
jgi:hypothetical protein